ncbi:MAG: hypothetical protein JNM26_01820 [Ideonella sp.]|nr:hypothetical protein [Ideonella sp.]
MMRPNREINIFNLSMLDVICGALGAFLILFLVAAPYFGNTSSQPPGEKLENQLLYMTSWEVPGADFDLWVKKPDDTWAGPKDRRLFGRIQPNFEFDNVDGRRKDTTWFEVYRRTDPTPGAYLIVGQLVKAAPAGPATAPGAGTASNAGTGLDLRGFVSADMRSAQTQIQVSIRPVRYQREGEVRINAGVTVGRDGRTMVHEYDDAWTGGPLPPRIQARLAEAAAATR